MILNIYKVLNYILKPSYIFVYNHGCLHKCHIQFRVWLFAICHICRNNEGLLKKKKKEKIHYKLHVLKTLTRISEININNNKRCIVDCTINIRLSADSYYNPLLHPLLHILSPCSVRLLEIITKQMKYYQQQNSYR